MMEAIHSARFYYCVCLDHYQKHRCSPDRQADAFKQQARDKYRNEANFSSGFGA